MRGGALAEVRVRGWSDKKDRGGEGRGWSDEKDCGGEGRGGPAAQAA